MYAVSGPPAGSSSAASGITKSLAAPFRLFASAVSVALVESAGPVASVEPVAREVVLARAVWALLPEALASLALNVSAGSEFPGAPAPRVGLLLRDASTSSDIPAAPLLAVATGVRVVRAAPVPSVVWALPMAWAVSLAECAVAVDDAGLVDAAETGVTESACALTMSANSGSLERKAARLVTAAVRRRDVSRVMPSMELAWAGVRPVDAPMLIGDHVSISWFGRTKAAGRTGGTAGIFIVVAKVAGSESWCLSELL